MTMLVNSVGRPEPSPEIQRRLAAITPGLQLRHLDSYGPRWAVVLAWGTQDRRWQWVQEERYDPASAFDIIGYLPLDCGLAEAAPYLERMLRTYPREDVQRMVDGVARWNEQDAGKADVEKAVAEVLDAPDPTKTEKKKRGRPRKET